MKSISEILGDLSPQELQAEVNRSVDRFHEVMETPEFNGLMEKLSLLLSDSEAEVVLSGKPENGYKKRDALMAFGENLMNLAEADPDGPPPRYVLFSMELLPFLIKRQNFGPTDIIGLAASLIMNVVISAYILKDQQE